MTTTNREFTAWDAFISFMEDIYYSGIIDESTSEFVNFHWAQFTRQYC